QNPPIEVGFWVGTSRWCSAQRIRILVIAGGNHTLIQTVPYDIIETPPQTPICRYVVVEQFQLAGQLQMHLRTNRPWGRPHKLQFFHSFLVRFFIAQNQFPFHWPLKNGTFHVKIKC
ncbi:MAG: hypothetical protein IJ960_06335, partial [Oscillospiraceae bacterium]|nr:hypothetical protein [Oscillospiraceae bacterium]